MYKIDGGTCQSSGLHFRKRIPRNEELQTRGMCTSSGADEVRRLGIVLSWQLAILDMFKFQPTLRLGGIKQNKLIIHRSTSV